MTVKFTPREVRATVSCERLSHRQVRIDVSDTGKGIADDVINTLFKTDAARTTAGTEGEKGSGLFERTKPVQSCYVFEKKLNFYGDKNTN